MNCWTWYAVMLLMCLEWAFLSHTKSIDRLYRGFETSHIWTFWFVWFNFSRFFGHLSYNVMKAKKRNWNQAYLIKWSHFQRNCIVQYCNVISRKSDLSSHNRSFRKKKHFFCFFILFYCWFNCLFCALITKLSWNDKQIHFYFYFIADLIIYSMLS